MQRPKTKWRADHGARAVKLVDRIAASIAQLDDEDLLDLQDIFADDRECPLETMASLEIERRGLSA